MTENTDPTAKRPVDVVNAMYAAANRGDMAGVTDAYAEDVVIEEAASLPFGGVYHGHDGFKAFIDAFTGSWEHFSNADLQVLDAGDTVIGLSRLQARSKRGVDVDVPLAEFFRVKDGRIVELKPFYFDGEAITRAIRG